MSNYTNIVQLSRFDKKFIELKINASDTKNTIGHEK